MKSKFTIVKDTVTKYLEKLEETSSNGANHENFLRDSAQEMHFNYVEPLMPRWNPNLMFSPLERGHQILEYSGGRATLELLYTGFTEEAKARELEHIYWEFGNPFDKTLGRDYSYYQETGVDKFAPSENERAPTFPGHHFVKRGTSSYLNQYHARTQAYATALLRGNKWKTEARISRTTYMEDFFW